MPILEKDCITKNILVELAHVREYPTCLFLISYFRSLNVNFTDNFLFVSEPVSFFKTICLSRKSKKKKKQNKTKKTHILQVLCICSISALETTTKCNIVVTSTSLRNRADHMRSERVRARILTHNLYIVRAGFYRLSFAEKRLDIYSRISHVIYTNYYQYLATILVQN